MAYFDTFKKGIWDDLGESYEMFKPSPLTATEVENSLLIADEIISKYEERTMEPMHELTLGKVLQESAAVYYNLGMHNTAQKAVSILQQVQFEDNQTYRDDKLTVQSMMVRTGAMISKRPYYIEVPRLFTPSSVHFMAHEVAHMLKETNPYECKGIYTDIEVIPILIELISAHKKKDNNVFKKRELIMYDTALSFKKLHQDRITNSIAKEDMRAFNACYRQTILYLNSFYYSLKLFAMYLSSPDYVLGIIDDVLSHRITSSEVIRHYLDDSDRDLDLGLTEFRSRLK